VRRIQRLWSPARTLVVAILTTLFLGISGSQDPSPALATKAGEWRTFTLEDGSIVTLGPRTVLAYEFNHNQRWIELISGEALFNVKKDPRRPFLVQTPVGCAKALGTTFSVSHHLQSTSVTTKEGIVAVARLDQGNPDEADPNCATNAIRLYAGQKAVIESWTPLVARAVDTEVELAWTSRKIIFTGQPVEQALREFNRRNWLQLDMPDHPEVLKIRIIGPFALDDPERFGHYLDNELRWRSQRQ
jgi:transmembrane sensor